MRYVTQLAKLFVDFLCTINMGVPLLTRHCVVIQNSISSRASQSSGARSIPSNAIAHTFVSGLAVTMDSCAPWCASQAKWCLHNISGWVTTWVSIQGASVAAPTVVTRGRSLLGGYGSSDRVQQTKGYTVPRTAAQLESQWRLWIQKMMFSLPLVPQTRC